MATLGNLKARLIAETNRDDLSDELATALTEVIQRAIEYFSLQRFTFNETRVVTSTSGEYADIPSGIRRIDVLSVTVGSNSYALRVQPYQVIEEWNNYAASSSGQPTDYSVSEGQYRFYPIPNTTYPIITLGVKDVAPAIDYDDADSSNAWLVQGYDLIAARCRYLLYRDYFRDDAGASIALGAELEAIARLREEASLLLGTGRVMGSW